MTAGFGLVNKTKVCTASLNCLTAVRRLIYEHTDTLGNFLLADPFHQAYLFVTNVITLIVSIPHIYSLELFKTTIKIKLIKAGSQKVRAAVIQN